jgi:hypothetical protein
MHGREHPLAKGSSPAEDAPLNPSSSHSAAFILGTLALGAVTYIGSGYVNSAINSLLAPPAAPESSGTLSHTANTVVNLGYASYRGLLNESVPDVVSWLGVPYAQPPRRFQAAHPLDETPREHEITDLFDYPSFCVQGWAPWASRKWSALSWAWGGFNLKP